MVELFCSQCLIFCFLMRKNLGLSSLWSGDEAGVPLDLPSFLNALRNGQVDLEPNVTLQTHRYQIQTIERTTQSPLSVGCDLKRTWRGGQRQNRCAEAHLHRLHPHTSVWSGYQNQSNYCNTSLFQYLLWLQCKRYRKNSHLPQSWVSEIYR